MLASQLLFWVTSRSVKISCCAACRPKEKERGCSDGENEEMRERTQIMVQSLKKRSGGYKNTDYSPFQTHQCTTASHSRI